MVTWFSSDLHFGHRWMATDHRGWSSIEDHDEAIIAEWNATIGANDEVYFLGDFSFHPRAVTAAIFGRLRGHKHLVVGNHDPKHIEQLPWVSVSQIKRVKRDKQSIYCCHYPMLTWPNAHRGTWHLHGHSHGNLRAPETTRVDVSYDAAGVALSWEHVAEIMSTRTYDFVDHHDGSDQ